MKILTAQLVLLILIIGCTTSPKSLNTLQSQLQNIPSLSGNKEYLSSPYVTAGDRVYSVGYQDGSFPNLGWHVTGEMGGIWDHPIKLMDGFQLALGAKELICLAGAQAFTNYPAANKHDYEAIGGVKVSRMQFVPDGVEGIVVEYQFENTNKESIDLNLQFTGRFDLRPVWLAERQNITDGEDTFKQIGNNIIASDQNNSWFAVLSSSLPIEKVDSTSSCIIETAGLGIDAVLYQSISLDGGQSDVVQYYISGSYLNEEAAVKTNTNLKNNAGALLSAKIERLSQLNNYNNFSSPNDDINAMYEWVRYNNDWLMRDVPEQGRGISAGIPDYPWWFGTDSGYAIEGLLAQGQWEDALATIELIIKLSEDANGESGKIMHEASTNGVVFNPGNLNTTPRFIHTLWMACSWTGKKELLDKYYDWAKKGILWIESQDKDGNGYADGPGMMEIHGLHTEMIDVVAYQEQAYRAAANFARVSGEPNQTSLYLQKADILKEKINTEWWSPEFSSYADFRATKEQAIELIEAAIVRADTLRKPWAVEELETTLAKVKNGNTETTQAYVAHHNWVVNTPLETGSADPEKAKLALEVAQDYQNRFGMFVTGIDRDEEQEAATKWKAFSYVGAVMTLPTGVQAIGAARYGNPDLAYGYLQRLQNSFSYALPGSMYEVSPDFGMIVQAWNNYAVAIPIVQYFFGITPMASEKTVILTPDLPLDWPSGRLENVRVGENLLTLDCTINSKEKRSWRITQTKVDWSVELRLPVSSVKINGEVQKNENGTFKLSGSKIELTY
ncbi:MAG: glycogen debranching protein [Bacteroidota bacterium]